MINTEIYWGYLGYSEVYLIEIPQFSVGDHESEDDDDTDEDEEGQEYSSQVADDPGVAVHLLPTAAVGVVTSHLGSLNVHVRELERSLQ